MSLLAAAGFRDSPFRIYLNTGTMYDIHTGVFVPGSHGGMVLNGGFTSTNAFVGRPKRFKSTYMFSLMMRALCIYSKSEAVVDDTEDAQKKDRVVRLAPYVDYKALEERLVITTPDIISAEEFFEFVKKLADNKLKNLDEHTVNSQILDPKTGLPIRMLRPTFVAIDSWSKLMSSFMTNALNTKEIGSSETNMIYMKDGNIKKMLMAQLPAIAARSGIYFLLSAHVGDQFELDKYKPPAKGVPNMKSSDKLKEVGADFNFVISNSSEMRSVDTLLDDKKEDALYPIAGSTTTELYELTSMLLSCKNSPSGTSLRTIISQKQGILSDLSNYHYIRKNEYFGLIGNNVTHKPAMTDVIVGRTKIREKLNDPEVCRAIQILAEMCYIQENWSTVGSEIDFMMKPEILAEKLLGSDSATIKDIIQSRGYWTYDESNVQPYMSTYDVLAIAQGQYKSKLHPVVTPKKQK